MNKLTKKRFLIFSIAALLIINISALSTIYYNSKMKYRNIKKSNIQQEQIRKNGMYRYFKDELKLSDEQFHKFKNINKLYISNAHNTGQKLKYNRVNMMNEIANINPDMGKLDSIANEIGQLHYELKINTINHFIELKSICNDKQQELLQKMFMKMTLEQDNGRMRKEQQRGGRNKNHATKRNMD